MPLAAMGKLAPRSIEDTTAYRYSQFRSWSARRLSLLGGAYGGNVETPPGTVVAASGWAVVSEDRTVVSGETGSDSEVVGGAGSEVDEPTVATATSG
jgi:hypothetical protein